MKGTNISELQRYSVFNQSSFRNNQSGNRDVSREMHKTKCSDCGKVCEVPFKPKEGRPVYCKECLPKHRN